MILAYLTNIACWAAMTPLKDSLLSVKTEATDLTPPIDKLGLFRCIMTNSETTKHRC